MLTMSVVGPNSPIPDVTTDTWSNGLMTSTTDPDGNEAVYTYNSLRQETSEQDYDTSGNLIGDTAYTYDANGFQLTMTVGATGPEPRRPRRSTTVAARCSPPRIRTAT
jgi:YD repeat-containing protein